MVIKTELCAFSQWKTSWLSREGVMAIATYIVGGLFALSWLFGYEEPDLVFSLLALMTLASALATVWCTGMIYASLPTIRAWSHPLVAPIYIVLALISGRLVLNALLASLVGGISIKAVWLMLLLLLGGWIAKTRYWSGIDEARRTSTAGTATGLGSLGAVRPLDPPHTQPNFVMREMGFQVARKHAERLRMIAVLTLFAIPAIACLLLIVASGWAAVLLAWIALLSAAVGVGVERWLFFAEAEHVAMLYYGRDAA